ncbi:MAG: hypothetical protein J5641_06390 [Bacteroidales bacterium]|nr:hypothetical protein [Bacteroidales bacterium]
MIHTKHFPPRGFLAITLFPFVFYNDTRITEKDVRHETVHLWQQAALLVIPFYLLYLTFWLYGLLRYHDSHTAYRNSPFEQSAYALEKETEVKPLRQAFDWIHYLKHRDSAL